jgi:hypothetical protein
MKKIRSWRLKMSNNLKYYSTDRTSRAPDLLFLLERFNIKSSTDETWQEFKNIFW